MITADFLNRALAQVMKAESESDAAALARFNDFAPLVNKLRALRSVPGEPATKVDDDYVLLHNLQAIALGGPIICNMAQYNRVAAVINARARRGRG